MSARHNTRITQEQAFHMADQLEQVRESGPYAMVQVYEAFLLSDDYCTCGNDLHGNNLCMRSACQWEGMKR